MSIYESFLGKYVICRSRNEGVNAGKVLALDETGVVLEDARRLFYHRPKEQASSWYEGVAKYGISEDSKLSIPMKKLIVEDYSLTLCSPTSERSIREHKAHGQG